MTMTKQLISALEDAAALVQQHVSRLSDADLDHPLPETDISVREALAQLLGWQTYTLRVLPQMFENVNVSLPPVNVASQNAAAVAAHGKKSQAELLKDFSENQWKLIALIKPISPEALTLRRTRDEKIFTIKSYVLDTLQQTVLEFIDRLQLMQ